MKKFLFSLLSMSVVVACNNADSLSSDSEQQSSDTRSINLRITQASSSRTIGEELEDGTYAIIGSGVILFKDSSGEIVYQRDLTSDEVTTVQNTSSTATTNEYISINDVPSTAGELFFIANVSTLDSSDYPDIIDESTSSARLRVDLLQGDTTYSPMSGSSSDFVSTDDGYTVNVVITPMVARLEVAQVSYLSQDDESDVSTDFTSFNLAGVYVNNIYPYVLTTGEPYTTDGKVSIVDQDGWDDDDWSSYLTANTVFPYYTDGSVDVPDNWTDGAMVDYGTSTDSALSFYPNSTSGSSATQEDESYVWSYQVVPSSSTATSDSPDVPHIILKLTDVEYVDNDLGATTRYVTVQNYTSTSGSIYSFSPGNVYRITNLSFSNAQASSKPYDDNISMTATVEVTPWSVVELSPDWN